MSLVAVGLFSSMFVFTLLRDGLRVVAPALAWAAPDLLAWPVPDSATALAVGAPLKRCGRAWRRPAAGGRDRGNAPFIFSMRYSAATT